MNVRRRLLDPNFVIPSSHTSRWHTVDPDDTSDSAQSEIDSDEGKYPCIIQLCYGIRIILCASQTLMSNVGKSRSFN